MGRTCGCGQTFDTLTSYRLHQRDDCPLSEEIDLDRYDGIEDAVADVVDELYTCTECERRVEGVESYVIRETEVGIVVEVEFNCPCGYYNDNTGILE